MVATHTSLYLDWQSSRVGKCLCLPTELDFHNPCPREQTIKPFAHPTHLLNKYVAESEE